MDKEKVLKRTSFHIYNQDSDNHYISDVEIFKAVKEIADKYNCLVKIEHKRMYNMRRKGGLNQFLEDNFSEGELKSKGYIE